MGSDAAVMRRGLNALAMMNTLSTEIITLNFTNDLQLKKTVRNERYEMFALSGV